jgi:osmotically-inducible protein OsmY
MIASLPPSLSSTDRSLAARIAAQLAATGRSALGRLMVEVRPGRIALRGQVQTFYEKQLAIQTCLMLAGGEWLIDVAEVSVCPAPHTAAAS